MKDGIKFDYTTNDYSSPKVYNCEEEFNFSSENNTITEFEDIVLTDYDLLQRYFQTWSNTFIPERFKGLLNKEEMEKFIMEKIEEKYPNPKTSNRSIEIDWNSFPKRI